MATAAMRYVSKEEDPHSSHALVLARVGDGAGRRLLDVGAAQGVLTRRFTERGFQVTAIEADPALAELARPHCAALVVANLDQGVPAAAVGPFDVIVCADVLEHLADPDRILRELVARLAPAGRIIISVPNVAHLWVRLQLLAGRFEYADRGILDRTHRRFFTRASFRRFLAEAGLAVEELTATPGPLPLVIPRRYHGAWLRAVQALSAALARAWKGPFAYQLVAVARRNDQN